MNARSNQKRQLDSAPAKSEEAFRTISEVAEELDTPAHVLRFWETKFTALRPMKRGGGRRYYRPEDVALLRGIKHLLHVEGYSICGAQKLFREQGPRYVIELGEGVVSLREHREETVGADLFDRTARALEAEPLEEAVEIDAASISMDPTPGDPITVDAIRASQAAKPVLSNDDRAALEKALEALTSMRQSLVDVDER